MKKTILFFLVVMASIATVSAQTVDEIVSKNLHAIGGVAKLREVKSLVLETNIKMQALQIENRTSIIVGKAMRSDSKIMGNTMVQAFDGTTSWAVTPVFMGGSGEAQIMTEEMSKSVINQLDPFPLLDYFRKGTTIELLPSENVKDKEAYHLRIIPKVGAESEIWIDVATGLQTKMKMLQNGQEVEIFFSNYAQIEGIYFAMYMEISNPMAQMIFDTKAVKINTAIDESIFTMPIAKN